MRDISTKTVNLTKIRSAVDGDRYSAINRAIKDNRTKRGVTNILRRFIPTQEAINRLRNSRNLKDRFIANKRFLELRRKKDGHMANCIFSDIRSKTTIVQYLSHHITVVSQVVYLEDHMIIVCKQTFAKIERKIVFSREKQTTHSHKLLLTAQHNRTSISDKNAQNTPNIYTYINEQFKLKNSKSRYQLL
ncbi:hypothetical protein M153_1600006293 [Pseudoloma neurophilia]|uniref:Uncharacterized protein n=1 Tax=Pseudoloma neurophilia TaxID=146866 RepID=A0A0R0LZJ1_9MICR|nr:hypothetical protein M153_1600006293 [Pseudoloma neurophilia]